MDRPVMPRFEHVVRKHGELGWRMLGWRMTDEDARAWSEDHGYEIRRAPEPVKPDAKDTVEFDNLMPAQSRAKRFYIRSAT